MRDTFVCPVCETPARTLEQILVCCPTQLRVLTEACISASGTTLATTSIAELLTGRARGRVQRFLLRRLAAA